MSGSESMLVRSWEQVCVDSESMRASITFAAGQGSEIGRYEVPRGESFPGLGIGMPITGRGVSAKL